MLGRVFQDLMVILKISVCHYKVCEWLQFAVYCMSQNCESQRVIKMEVD